MNHLYEELIFEEKQLKELIETVNHSIINAPTGRLRISLSGKMVQYYYKPDEADDHFQSAKAGNYHYIRKENIQFARSLAQKDYDAELLKVAEKRLKCVQALLKHYRENETEQIYEKLNSYRKALVEPRIITDQAHAAEWEKIEYTGKSFEEGTAVIYSNKGERVRSKSEKIIADMLQKEGIPYRYEAPVSLRGMGTVHPDFTILNVKERKEIYWEHLGMMDNQSYCENALRKIEIYQKNGLILGDQLILTYETTKHPLETAMIERNIRNYCQ